MFCTLILGVVNVPLIFTLSFLLSIRCVNFFFNSKVLIAIFQNSDIGHKTV